jgi:membrane fusion protein (multidrug efflux system)
MINALKALGVIVVCVVVVVAVQRFIGKAKPKMRPRGGGEAVVRVVKVQEQDFADRIEAVGTAKANESVNITATVSEQVKSVLFKEGSTVQAGDVLVQLEAAEEEALLKEAVVNRDEQKREMDRIRKLKEKEVQTGQKFDQQVSALKAAEARLQQAEARLRDRRVVAPFSGILGIREISPGALVEPGTSITTLDDIDRIKLDFTIPEIYIAVLSKGQRIEAHSAAWPERSFSGTVGIISPRVNSTTRAVQVRAIIPNPDKLLRPGMLLTVTLIANPRRSLSVPEACLVAYGKKQFVYVKRDDSAVEKREVRLGSREVGRVEVLSGLRAGETVVTDGVMNLRDGAKVRVTGNPENSKVGLSSSGCRDGSGPC